MALNLFTVSLVLVGITIIALINVTRVVDGADPDPLVDIPTTQNQFVLRDLLNNGAVSRDTGGIRAAVNITNLPLTL